METEVTAVKFFDRGHFCGINQGMTKPLQKRARETRTRLIKAARKVIATNGFEALRVEEVVLLAGVAKGTFFAHFKDKDALLDLLVAQDIDAQLDMIAALAVPKDVPELVSALTPLLSLMTGERFVFDLILRHSVAAAIEEVGPIASTFDRQTQVLAGWLADGPFRKDVCPQVLAEGIQAFAIQAMALRFCALHRHENMRDRLQGYLQAWLLPERAVHSSKKPLTH